LKIRKNIDFYLIGVLLVKIEKESRITNKYDNSCFFEVWLWSNKPAIKDAADFLYKKIKKFGIPNNLKINRLKNHLKVFLVNLYSCHQQDKKQYIAISLRKGSYSEAKYLKKIFLNYRYVKYIMNFLGREGYIDFKRGFQSNFTSRVSRMKASQKLLRLFRKYEKPGCVILNRKPAIVLRNEDKIEIDYDMDNQDIRKLLINVNRINKYLSQHKIELFTLFDQSPENLEMYRCFSKYHRVFNNSSFEHGGRFYGHCSQAIESYRRCLIQIYDKDTVELDYSCLHISMLYGFFGETPPEGDLYQLDNISNVYRKIIKKAVNIAINAKDMKLAMSAIQNEMVEFCEENDLQPIRPKILLTEILAKHDKIKQYFCSGYGTRLQYLDSQIAEKILLTLGKECIGCLCIHDSFILAEEYKDRLMELMRHYFYEILKFYPNVSEKKVIFN